MHRVLDRTRPRTRLSILLSGLVLAVGSLVLIPQLGGQVLAQDLNPLKADLDTLLADPDLAGSDIGLEVRTADGGQVLYHRESERRQQPASNAKLLTSAAAVEVLGLGYEFRTSVFVRAHFVPGVLDGDLYLQGSGDPTMLAADYDDLAAQVAAAGVQSVRGNLVADDTWFDDVRLGTGWAWDDEPFAYNPQTSALTLDPDVDLNAGSRTVYDAGAITVKVSPTQPGAPALVETVPPTDFVHIASSVVTGQPGSTKAISIDREHGSNNFTVSGSIPPGPSHSRPRAVWDPTGYAAAVFRAALAAHGVRVDGPTTRGATPPDVASIASHQSMPLGELLVPFLKRSNNSHAEALVKAMGRIAYGQGTWAAGLRAVRDKLPGLGIDLEKTRLRLEDGSGLSRMDQVSPDQVADLLIGVRSKPWYSTWYNALPIAGSAGPMVSGTLNGRMTGTAADGNLRGKTGTYTGTSALSGYVTAANGQLLVFSLISNNYMGSDPDDEDNLKTLENKVGVRLAQYAGEQDQRQPALVAPQDAGGNAPARDAGVASGRECSWVGTC